VKSITVGRDRQDIAGTALRVAIAALTLGTAYIHYTLGGTLFLLNAVGYTVLAAALLVPGDLASRFRWMPRLALLGFTAMTIGGWVLFGARYDVAYLSKAIEVGIIGLLLIEGYLAHGSPMTIARKIRSAVSQLRSHGLAGA
jgi:hypothetical protein